MAKSKKHTKRPQPELDSVYVLKLVLYLVLGSQWIWLNHELTRQIPIPLGLIIGILFAAHDHFKIDRKIEYAVLLVASFIGFWSQVGLTITILK